MPNSLSSRGPARTRLRALALVLALAPLSTLDLRAEEGMWFPPQLPGISARLQAAGLEVSPESLSRLTEHPMAAVTSLGGCSASFVSPRGLVVTNHHCVYGSLAYNSTEERDLVKAGLVARTPAEEIPARPGTRVYVAERVQNVTSKVLKGLEGLTDGAARYAAIEEREKKLVAQCEKKEGRRCRVYSFYGGLDFQLVQYLELRDVRHVYSPPGAIGRYGGDIDNWMWPRHTGDFSFYRVYVAPDGNPADYSADNVPFQPPHHLKIAPGGVDEDDFVMVIGYPGRTSRYRLATEVESRFGWFYPQATRVYGQALEIINSATADDPAAAMKYRGTISGLNNSMKNYEGMLAGFESSGMVERKQGRESELQAWIDADADRAALYGQAVAELHAAVEAQLARRDRDFALTRLARTSMLSTARRLYRLSAELEKPNDDREPGYQERDMAMFRQRLERLDRSFHPAVAQALLTFYLSIYDQLPDGQRIVALDEFLGLSDPATELDERLSAMYEKSRLGQSEFRMGLIGVSTADIVATEDPFLQLAAALYESDMQREQESEAEDGELMRLRARYMQALLAFLESRGETGYADANGTLRVTYGKTRGYSPRDGVFYLPFTTLDGLLAKASDEPPFDAPATLVDAIQQRRFGPHRVPEFDSVPVNFLSNVDTTGGNSGSPTLNGKGELVGLLFDGTWDSINADWDFNETTTRSIHVDVRYMLWIMDQVDDARYLLEEMGL